MKSTKWSSGVLGASGLGDVERLSGLRFLFTFSVFHMGHEVNPISRVTITSLADDLKPGSFNDCCHGGHFGIIFAVQPNALSLRGHL